MCMLILYELKLKIPWNNSDIIKMYKHSTDKMRKSDRYAYTYFLSAKKRHKKQRSSLHLYLTRSVCFFLFFFCSFFLTFFILFPTDLTGRLCICAVFTVTGVCLRLARGLKGATTS